MVNRLGWADFSVRCGVDPACYSLVIVERAKAFCCAQLPPDLAGLAWVQYMRWARRADSVSASRKLFVKARKWPQCPWQVHASLSTCCFLKEESTPSTREMPLAIGFEWKYPASVRILEVSLQKA